MDDTTLDGNAAGGILREVFPFELTIAEETCAHCGTTRTVGEITVYKSAMGTVMCCPTCGQVLMRMVSTRGRYWLDMQGVRVLQIITEL
jgi:NAD-dependent SIR2 family protein deacetylase